MVAIRNHYWQKVYNQAVTKQTTKTTVLMTTDLGLYFTAYYAKKRMRLF